MCSKINACLAFNLTSLAIVCQCWDYGEVRRVPGVNFKETLTLRTLQVQGWAQYILCFMCGWCIFFHYAFM